MLQIQVQHYDDVPTLSVTGNLTLVEADRIRAIEDHLKPGDARILLAIAKWDQAAMETLKSVLRNASRDGVRVTVKVVHGDPLLVLTVGLLDLRPPDDTAYRA
jgi:repressor of nif and glnA expression